MSNKLRKIAVLTGDLVNSTGLGPENVERAFDALEACAKMQADWMEGQSLHFTRHRGDGWQVALADPKYALRSALCFRAALRALGEEFDSYIGIAEGEVEGEIGPDLNEETALPFLFSGTTLEALRLNSIGEKTEYFTAGYLNGAALFLDKIADDWTRVQAQTMLVALAPNHSATYTEIAQKLGKSRQSVTKTLQSAGSHNVLLGLTNIEAAHA
ncbi:hypothetical protein [Celeribacter halophilus]|uniref:hypothetical protein n=1 Tax=Celeribacter halophilus TaxID=576117 RepID=UPI003A8CB2E6